MSLMSLFDLQPETKRVTFSLHINWLRNDIFRSSRLLKRKSDQEDQANKPWKDFRLAPKVWQFCSFSEDEDEDNTCDYSFDGGNFLEKTGRSEVVESDSIAVFDSRVWPAE